MKIKIKVKVFKNGHLPVVTEKGDWIDLKSAIDVTSIPSTGNAFYIPLGIAIKLPKGFEAIVASRSSAPRRYGIFIPNGIGIIDNSYSGNGDEWMLVAHPLHKNITAPILSGDRICQFRIQLSQNATFWQKLKWLFSSGVELVEVANLDSNNRGGLGSSGVK